MQSNIFQQLVLKLNSFSIFYPHSLLEKDRPLTGVRSHERHRWRRSTDKSSEQPLIEAKDVYGDRAIFPLHNALPMAEEVTDQHLEQLRDWDACNKKLSKLVTM